MDEVDPPTSYDELAGVTVTKTIAFPATYTANDCAVIFAGGEHRGRRLAERFGIGRRKRVAGRYFGIGGMAGVPPAGSRQRILRQDDLMHNSQDVVALTFRCPRPYRLHLDNPSLWMLLVDV
jgi:hypothetical protein